MNSQKINTIKQFICIYDLLLIKGRRKKFKESLKQLINQKISTDIYLYKILGAFMKKLKKVKNQEVVPFALTETKIIQHPQVFNKPEQFKDIINQVQFNAESEEDDEEDHCDKRKRKKKVDILEEEFQFDKQDDDQVQIDDDDLYDDNLILDKLPKKKHELEQLYETVKRKIVTYKKQFFHEQAELKNKKSNVHENSIPICADIRQFNFQLLIKSQMQYGARQFDVIMMDPPWKLSSAQPSRGVAIQYNSLADEIIEQIPVNSLQTNGFICIWTINAKYRFTCKLIQKWGYKLIDQMTWVKKTINGKIAKGHGFYLQHAKESCLIGVKGTYDSQKTKKILNVASDVIFSERRGQSQKPTQMYEYIQKLVPNGFYLQIFGRRNNLRGNWVTIGNQI